jgi:hypothetical protein
LAFGALFIKQLLGLSDEETVEQIRENVYMRFLVGFTGYSSKILFDPSMMVHFRKRFSEEELNRITELIVERGSAPSSGVTQEVLGPFLEGEQEQSGDDRLEADCPDPFCHYRP